MSVGGSMQGREVGKGRKEAFMALACNLKVAHFLLLSAVYKISQRNSYAFCLL